MDLIVGGINKKWLLSLVHTHTAQCDEVKAAVAYAANDNLDLFEACRVHSKPLLFYGRYDLDVPVAPEVIKWFLDARDPTLSCRMVSDFLHAKVIWWIGRGAYIGSANLTNRAWTQNIEAGTFITDEEMDDAGMIEDLRSFFEVVDSRSQAISSEFYEHLRKLARARQPLHGVEADLLKGIQRFFAPGQGLVPGERTPAMDRAFSEFQKRWREALQILRDIGVRVSSDQFRPTWIPADTPVGVQADQFIHAYYYKFVGGHRGDKFVVEAHAKNKDRLTDALTEALLWWKAADFDHTQESRSMFEWAPRLRELFGQDRIRSLDREEFVEALSTVHAVIDYGNKRTNAELGLADDASPKSEEKVRLFAQRLWNVRTKTGRTPIDVLHYLIWGGGDAENRIWAAARTDPWRIRGVNFSSLGEILGWARPEVFPPRNDRTIKGLRCLGYNVRSV